MRKPKLTRGERERRASQAAREHAVASGRAYLRPLDLASRWGCHRITLYRWIKKGSLPKPVRLFPGVVGWPVAAIEALERARALAS